MSIQVLINLMKRDYFNNWNCERNTVMLKHAIDTVYVDHNKL